VIDSGNTSEVVEGEKWREHRRGGKSSCWKRSMIGRRLSHGRNKLDLKDCRRQSKSEVQGVLLDSWAVDGKASLKPKQA
jgi:hypothetical protein